MSPCGEWLAWRDERDRRAICVAGKHGTALEHLVLAASPVTRLCWRPESDGPATLLLVTQRGKLIMLQPGLFKGWLLDLGGEAGVKSAEWARDGSKLLLFSGQRWFLATPAEATGADDAASS
jgi:hypothetical protein